MHEGGLEPFLIIRTYLFLANREIDLSILDGMFLRGEPSTW